MSNVNDVDTGEPLAGAKRIHLIEKGGKKVKSVIESLSFSPIVSTSLELSSEY